MDKSNITACSQVSQPIVQDEQTGQPEQMVSFEQGVRPFLSDDLRAEYRHLSDEDRRLIENAIRAAFVKGEVDLASGGRYANNLASFADSLGAKGLSMVGLNTKELEAERKAGHNRGTYLPAALRYLSKFRDPDASAEAASSRKPRGRPKIKNFGNEQLMGGPPPKRRRLLDDEPPHLRSRSIQGSFADRKSGCMRSFSHSAMLSPGRWRWSIQITSFSIQCNSLQLNFGRC
ncbi:hypothetical protein [Bradyrhizobium archetypum]|uniref:Uncharacterized protein n=1 Tax=Bradyrhizobium archetypum TaxID=2721160 RepID=A0A7Y4H9P7_9BRAD|nr:hypothetical protein [Bradyrhizobium archetypum]NOJ50245.1 hypothetical protein [Bradyrhizobium archetypum]